MGRLHKKRQLALALGTDADGATLKSISKKQETTRAPLGGYGGERVWRSPPKGLIAHCQSSCNEQKNTQKCAKSGKSIKNVFTYLQKCAFFRAAVRIFFLRFCVFVFCRHKFRVKNFFAKVLDKHSA